MATYAKTRKHIGTGHLLWAQSKAMPWPLTQKKLQRVLDALVAEIESPDTPKEIKARLADRIGTMQEHNAKLIRMQLEYTVRLTELQHPALPPPEAMATLPSLDATYAAMLADDPASASPSAQPEAPQQDPEE